MTTTKLIPLLLIFIVGCFFAFAAEIPTTTFINAPPNITILKFSDNDLGNIQVTATDDTILNCSGSIEDFDGYADIQAVNATMWGPSSTMNSANSFGTKYSNSSCLLYGGSGNTTLFDCSVLIHHHSEPGIWSCNVTANDSFNVIGYQNATDPLDDFKSIAVPLETINFGSYAWSQNSGTNDFGVLLNNTGNIAVNFTVDAYQNAGQDTDSFAMNCSVGGLPVGSIRFAETSGIAATSKIALVDAASLIQSNLTPTAFGFTAYTNYNIYFGIVIPVSGQSGTCNGFIDISAY